MEDNKKIIYCEILKRNGSLITKKKISGKHKINRSKIEREKIRTKRQVYTTTLKSSLMTLKMGQGYVTKPVSSTSIDLSLLGNELQRMIFSI